MAVSRPTRSPARPAAVLAVLTLLAGVVSLLALSGTAQAQATTCADFTSWEAAQAAFDADRVGLAGLDSNGNGEACEDLRDDGAATARVAEETDTSVTPSTPPPSDPVNALVAGAVIDAGSTTWSTTTTTSSTDDSDSDDNGSSGSDDDKDCADFASQADAQAALDAAAGDPDNLDADDDGIACEQYFGEDGQQVQVHPTGGVDTGGLFGDA